MSTTAHQPDTELPNPMDSGPYRSVPLAAVILGFAAVALHWNGLPDTIPVRFNAAGEAINYGTKWLLWLLPVVNFGVLILTRRALDGDFQRYNIPLVPVTEENRAAQRRINLQMGAQVRLIVCVLIAHQAYEFVRSAAAGRYVGSSAPLFALLGLLLAVIAFHLYRSYQARG